MLGKLTNKILGKKEAKPYSDIPIFESLDSIGGGLPLTTTNLKEVESLNEGNSKTPTKEFPRPMSTRSGQKRARQALLGDKENVPKLPGANNILDEREDHAQVFKGKRMKASYYDEKHGDSDNEADVTVESVDDEDSDEGSPSKKAKVVDNRFETERAISKNGPSKKVAFAINRDDNYDAMDEQKDDEGLEERPEDDELETREILFSKIRHGHRDWVSNYIKSQSTD